MFWNFDLVQKSIFDHWVNAGLHSEEESILSDPETVLGPKCTKTNHDWPQLVSDVNVALRGERVSNLAFILT